MTLVSLQKGVEPAAGVSDLGPDYHGGDWSDTAAIVAQLDLVVGVDTSVVHLAGALGVPVWLAIPFGPDWRWLLGRDASPWYPTLRLFRQPSPGEWDAVFDRIVAELHRWSSDPAVRTPRLVSLSGAPARAATGPDEAVRELDRGVERVRQGDRAGAEAAFRAALEKRPDFAAAHFNLGCLFAAEDRTDDAVAAYREALRCDAGFVPAHINLGAALGKLKRPAEAEACYREALRLKPTATEALTNLAGVLTDADRPDESLALLREAERLGADGPELHMQYGVLFGKLDRFAEAETRLRRVVALKPAHPEALLELGNVFLDQNRTAEAVGWYREAVRAKPGDPAARKNLGMALLVAGEWAEGWREYEYRWGADARSPFPQPAWDGSPLGGRTILLHAEQGLGDTLQFVRYAPLVKARGGRVVLRCQAALAELLARFPGVDYLVTTDAPPPPFDIHAPLMSLPGILGTTVETVPADVPYLSADSARRAVWRSALSARPGFRVGIVWRGNPGHKRDTQRSVPLTAFAPLARVSGVRLVSLQKGAGLAELADHGPALGVVDLGGAYQSGTFADTAAVVSELDLVVGVDTSVIHLCGALGVPVWVAVTFSPDWRWLLGRDDSPWYPTLRLFRQPAPGDWASVFGRIADALARRAGPPGAVYSSCPPAPGTRTP